MDKKIDIELIISKLSKKRQVFSSEADLQLEMAWIIKKEYPKAQVRLEYCPLFDLNMHIDILVIFDNKWIPIELKYKTKGNVKKTIGNDTYFLKEHGAKDVNCYLYLKDIQRIERIRDNINNFIEGYTIFITNQINYMQKPIKDNCVYKDFSLENHSIKTGKMDWSKNASDGTKRNCEKAIVLKDEYEINWKEYSKIDDTTSGRFICLVNKIKSKH